MEHLLRLLSRPVIRLTDAAFALFFLYLAGMKLLDSHEIARLAYIGVGPTRRVLIATIEIAAALLFAAGASGYLLAPLVVGTAVIEVVLLQRPPILATMCVGSFGITAWARTMHDRRVSSDRTKEVVSMIIDP